jgi:hypothetical protein
MAVLLMISCVQERESEGPFTFQVILRDNGDIEFAYESIPLAITTIQDEEHPVKVGLSDAYIIDRTIFCKLTLNLVALSNSAFSDVSFLGPCKRRYFLTTYTKIFTN